MDTTVEISNKVGGAEIVSRIVEDLKDENEQFRKMVMDCVEKVSWSHDNHMILDNYYIFQKLYYLIIYLAHLLVVFRGLKRRKKINFYNLHIICLITMPVNTESIPLILL